MRQVVCLSALILLNILNVSEVFANDGVYGGEGADLVPLRETRIKMQSEDILLEQDLESQRWFVKARYVFANPTHQTIELQMGFPENRWRFKGPGGEQKGFKNMKTLVRGVEVPQRIGQVSKSFDWVPEIGRVFLYDVTFAPYEVVQIDHTYSFDETSTVDGEHVDYITRTGQLWNGPIGHARFVVRTHDRPWYLQYPDSFNLVSSTESAKGQIRQITEIVFEMKRWIPTSDFHLLMGYNPSIAVKHAKLDCPHIHKLYWGSFDGSLKGEALKTIQGYTDDQLKTCRNVFFAAHGRRFKNEELNRRYYRYARVLERDQWPIPSKVFVPNKRYTESLLYFEERRAVNALRQEELRRKKGR